MPVGNPKTMKNFRLSGEAIELLEKLSAERGISQAAVIEQAVRDFSRKASEPKASPGQSPLAGESGSREAQANAQDSTRKSA